MIKTKRDKFGYSKGTHKRKRAPKPPKEVGRPTLYNPAEHPRVARQNFAEGHTIRRLADILGISHATIAVWASTHAAFGAAIEMGRQDATDAVELALHKRATGYDHPAEKILVIDGQVERVKTTEHYPADIAANKLWLTNRRPKEWKDKTAVEHTGLDALAAKLASARKRVPPKEEQSS